MSTNNSRLQYLASQYLNDKSTPEELEEFWQHLRNLKDETPMQPVLQDLWQQSTAGNDTPAIGWDQVLQHIYDKANPYLEEQAEIIPLRKRPVIRWAAAAAIVLTLGVGSYWLLNRPSGSKDVVLANTAPDVQPPQINRASITLANGKKVYLDSAANGSLAAQGNVQLVKLADGQIAYNGSANEIVYNTLTNPRGSKVINMKLADGSHVWLNAGSSITYPVAFLGKERKVEIHGEVYFEVSSLPAPSDGGGVKGKIPFIVDINGKAEVEVLGTHFNINAYHDEESIKTTLLEGKVKVSAMLPETLNPKPVILSPGEQALLTTDHKLQTTNNIKIDEVMAWKNGLFSFAGADLKTVMRQLARWYNIDVKYDGPLPTRKFSGEITHDLTLSQLMNGLQSLGVQFSIEGRTMIVKQK